MGCSVGRHWLVQINAVPGAVLGMRVVSSAGADEFLMSYLLSHTAHTENTLACYAETESLIFGDCPENFYH